MGWGCWSGIAPDNSYRFFSLQGNHRMLNLFDPGSAKSRKIDGRPFRLPKPPLRVWPGTTAAWQ